MKMINSKKNYKHQISLLYIILAGMLWGTMGIFVRTLNKHDLTTMDIVFLRAIVTTVILTIVLLVFKRDMLRIRLKDIWCFIGTGVASITFFNFCYFKAIMVSSLSIAAVLLYTAPAIVMVLSVVLFHEKFTWQKCVAIVITFIGCVMVTGAINGGSAVNAKGILYGLGAGFGYALYSVFSRYALDRGYHSLTITFYTFVFSALSTAFFVDLKKVLEVTCGSPKMFGFACLFGATCTILPYLLYTLGLVNVENSKASILASIEPVTASILGIVIFGETLSVSAVVGIVLVIGALVISNVTLKKKG